MTPNACNILGLVSNLLGTTIVAFSGGLYLRLLDTSVSALEVTVHSFLNKQIRDVPLITGLDTHRETESRRAKRWVVFGMSLIIVGFALQLAALLIPPAQAKAPNSSIPPAAATTSGVTSQPKAP